MNVLITSAGKRVSLVEMFQKELSSIDPSGKVMTTDANPSLSAACQVSPHYFKVPKIDDKDYITTMLKICNDHDIKLLIPTIDTELLILAENRKIFSEIGTAVVICDVDFVKKCRDKRLIHNFFSEHGVEVAREFDKNNYELPLFIKPSDGSRSEDIHLIKEKHQLNKRFINEKRFMFLEYLSPEYYDEYTCDLYYTKRGVLKCAVPRKRIEVRDGEVNKGLTQNNILVPYIKEKLSRVKGVRGCLTFQFFLEKEGNRIVGIEVNPRFGGGYPLSYLSGANYIKWILEEYILDKCIDDKFDSWEDNLLMLRYDKEILVHGHKG